MAETIHVRGEGGSVIPMDLPLHPDIAKRLEAGQLRRVDADGSPYREPEPPEADVEPDDDGEPKRPAKAASKDDWLAYVLAALDMEAAEVESLTKADLIALADMADASE